MHERGIDVVGILVSLDTLKFNTRMIICEKKNTFKYEGIRITFRLLSDLPMRMLVPYIPMIMILTSHNVAVAIFTFVRRFPCSNTWKDMSAWDCLGIKEIHNQRSYTEQIVNKYWKADNGKLCCLIFPMSTRTNRYVIRSLLDLPVSKCISYNAQ